MTTLWSVAVLLAGIFCVARAIVDFRMRKYGWGIFGIVSAAILLFAPIQSQAVKFDLPASSAG